MNTAVPPHPDASPSRRSRFRLTPRTWLFAGLAAVVIIAGGFTGVYLTLFNGSSAAPLTLSSSPSSGSHLSAAAAAGTWSIAAGSVVGYRVREKLAFLPAKSDAVGRTSDVAGTLSVTDSGSNLTITTASFLANVRTLKSDRSMRDAQIHRIGLQSNQYPTASFQLNRPFTLPATVLQGKVVHATATGRMTIHGTTRTVSVPIMARGSGSAIEAVGSMTFPFSEFGMQAPSIAGFVSVENHATLEFDLHFQHGASTRNTATLRSIAALQPITSSAGGFGLGAAPGPGPNGKGFQALSACLSKHGVSMPAPGAGPSRNPKVAAAMKACGANGPRGGAGPASGPPSQP